MAKGPQVGDTLPDFELRDQDDKPVRLADHRGKAVVLYFYPKDETPGCTAEACSFRDSFQDFQDAGAVVMGVSDDDPATHKAFAEHHGLPFTLLADKGGRLRRRLGVPKSLGLIPGRVTYVLDGDGVVRHVFNSQTQATQHIQESLTIIRDLA